MPLPIPGPGRPHTLTETIIEKICGDLRKGMIWSSAVEGAGIEVPCAEAWLRNGAKDSCKNELERRFFMGVREARREAEAYAVETMRLAQRGELPAGSNPAMAVEWLRRARYREWGDKKQVETIVAPPAEDYSTLEPIEMKALARLRVKTATTDEQRAEWQAVLESLAEVG